MTKKLEIIWVIGVVLAACGIVMMWVLYSPSNKVPSTVSVAFAGGASFVALVAKGLAALRRYNGAID